MKDTPILQMIRFFFPLLEKLSPGLADRLFHYLFLHTFPYSYNTHQQAFLDKAEKGKLQFNGKEAITYTWGPDSEKTVLFVHGWMGHSAQFQVMVEQFREAGYRCVCLDAPAHGASKGNSTNLIDFRDSIIMAAAKFGSFEMIVGHSLGGAATVLANKEDKLSKKLILISAPTHGPYILKSFARGIGASEHRFNYLRYRLYRDLGISFSQVMLTESLKELHQSDLLFIYDKRDPVLYFDHLAKIRNIHPASRYVETEGLGHNKILRNSGVIALCSQFPESKPLPKQSGIKNTGRLAEYC